MNRIKILMMNLKYEVKFNIGNNLFQPESAMDTKHTS